NLPHARSFLGDTGSYLIGGWVALVAIAAISQGVPPESVAGLVAIYVADTFTTVVLRVFRGETWFEPHQDHAYHRLTKAGWSHTQVSMAVTGLTCLTSALGFVSLTDSDLWRIVADIGLIAVVAIYVLTARRLQP